MQKKIDSVCFFGGYTADYPRSDLLRKGLKALGVQVHECRATTHRNIFGRYPDLIRRYRSMDRGFQIIYVPEFRHKDVPLAWLLGKLEGRFIVFDPLVSRYETKIKDRRDAREGTFQSLHNRGIDRLSLRLPGLILSDTRAHAEYYGSEFGVPRSKVKVLPVGFDDTHFIPSGSGDLPAATNGRHTILFYGTYLPLHGIDTIIEAATLLKDRGDIHFRLIGGGQTFSEVQAMVASRRLSEVELMPSVAFDTLPRRIEESTICLGIFGTTEKAHRVVPNKLFQCLGMGKPVITADTKGVQEFFIDGETISLVHAGDGKALADKIEALLAAPDDMDRMGRNARALMMRDFGCKQIAGMFLKYCEEALSP